MKNHMRLAIPFSLCLISVAAIIGTHDTPAHSMGMPGLDATKPLGQPPAEAPQTNAEGLIAPTFTDAQVARGQTAYTKNCAECHGPGLNDGEFGGAPLNGSYFHQHWGDLTVDALYGFLSSAMPPDRPGRLTPQTYADITAFLLDRNGYKSGSQELPADLGKMSTMSLATE
jgi:mono/diheme cytochrome c family protein